MTHRPSIDSTDPIITGDWTCPGRSGVWAEKTYTRTGYQGDRAGADITLKLRHTPVP